MSERSEVLRKNEYLRNNDGVRKTDGLRWALSIPEDDYPKLLKLNPALNSRDKKERDDAWMKFIKDPVSIPYRVME